MKLKYFLLLCLVFVKVGVSQDWYSLGSQSISAGTLVYLSMAVASDGTPYLGYTDQANGAKAAIKKYDGSSWVSVGAAGFSTGTANYMNMTLASDGTPYVVYQDGNNSNKATVQKFDGTNWVVVGSAGFSEGAVTNAQIKIKSDGTPYVGFSDGAHSSKPTAMYFDGSTWNIVGTAGFTTSTPSDQYFALSNDGTPYFAFRTLTALVTKFDGTNWVDLSQSGLSIGTAYYIKLVFSPSNIPHIVFSDGNPSYLTVMSYDGILWTKVGGAAVTSAITRQPCLAFASDETPYVAYQDNALRLAVQRYVSGSWGYVGSSQITTSNVDYPTIAINSQGTPYLACTESAVNDKATLRRFTSNAADPLPVELTSFTALLRSSSVELNWQTATEINNYGFEIERASVISNEVRNLNWQKVGFVQGHGNSNSTKQYSFTDDLALDKTLKFSYRLKQIDNDGTFKYSKEVEVNTQLPTKSSLSQNYPNPFNPSTLISYQISVNSFVTLKVYDVLGKEVATLVNESKEAGNYEITFNASKLASGVYFYRLQGENGLLATKKFMLVK